MRVFALVLGAMVAAAPAAAGQDGVVLRARPEVGQSYRYDIQASFTLIRGNEPSPQTLEQRARVRFTVASVDEAGTAVVRAAFESIKATLKPAGNDAAATTFEWAQGVHPAEVPETSLSPMYTELAETILEFRVGPDGGLAKVEGFDDVLNAGGAEELSGPEQALGIFGPDATRAHLGVIWSLDRSGAAREIGQSWVMPRTVAVTPTAAARSETRWVLRSIKDKLAEVSGPIVVTLDTRSPPINEAQPKLAITEQSGTAAATWDTGRERLITCTTENKMVWVASLALERPIQSRRATASRVQITLVDDPAEKP